MLQKVGGGYDSQALSPPAPLIGKAGFAALVAALETALIVSASILCGIAYHLLAYQETGPVGEFALAGLLVAVLFVSSFAFRGDYRVDRFLDGRRDPARLLKVWVYAIVAVTVVGFLAKASGTLSRGWFLLFFAAGLAAVIGLDSALQHYAAKAVQAGWIEPRRLLIIGDTDHLDRLVDLEKSDHGAIAVMSTINLPALQIILCLLIEMQKILLLLYI
ncbi:MAG: hypothetical protein K0U34_02510 [Alphaproteobacteria bacterium]|nr:hypothetical protein [Alphaproteobacteria bacterium]